MGQLWYPFIAGCAALLIAGAVLGQTMFPRLPSEQQVIYGLLMGILASVVLYAVMRAIAERTERPKRPKR